MSTTKLGRLEPVEPRDIWPSEPEHFTPWLAEAENLRLLGDTIGLDLELEAKEKDVGPFSADILCRDTATGDWVLIENQLERTDHTHLGQLMTYAAGLKAATIVWVARQFTEEHRAALDWLNEITAESFSFFGLEVEVWRIGNSPAAPKFNLVAKPNDWTRQVTKASGADQMSDHKRLQLEFWTGFRDYVASHAKYIRPMRPQPQSWVSMGGLGRSGFALQGVASAWNSATQSYSSAELRAELVMSAADAAAAFDALKAHKAEIEAESRGTSYLAAVRVANRSSDLSASGCRSPGSGAMARILRLAGHPP